MAKSLCHELAQAEQSARVHPLREARRLGDIPPARALIAVSNHARSLQPRLEALLSTRIDAPGIGRLAGESLSRIRQLVVDRVLTTQQSFRFTLIGITHGVDGARLLRAVAEQRDDQPLETFCAELLRTRIALLEDAHAALAWFAQNAREGQLSGFRRLLRRAPTQVLQA